MAMFQIRDVNKESRQDQYIEQMKGHMLYQQKYNKEDEDQNEETVCTI